MAAIRQAGWQPWDERVLLRAHPGLLGTTGAIRCSFLSVVKKGAAMTTKGLTVETIPSQGHYKFLRSDGESFFMVPTENGGAVLYHGTFNEGGSRTGIVDFDANVSDKVANAERWILTHPDEPV